MEKMSKNTNLYERPITGFERMLTWSPYSIVTMVARIKGNVNTSELRDAITKLQQRHTLLRVRVKLDKNNIPWFTSENNQDLPIKIVLRKNESDWINIINIECKIPFLFETQTPIRFILIYSPEISELVIVCHHIICDGLSLAYLARDILEYLGNPKRLVEILPDPVPISSKSMPKEVNLNGIVKFFVNKQSQKWKAMEIYFNQQDYEELTKVYWQHFQHQMISIELSEEQTTTLVLKCHTEKVTVNSALTMAFIEAQIKEQGDKIFHSKIGIASNLRDRLQNPVGEVMGLYAGLVNLNHRYNHKKSFWENVRIFHRKVQSRYTNKELFQQLLLFDYLNPAILESRHFKVLGSYISTESPCYEKIHKFSQQEDMVLVLLKHSNQDSVNTMYLGTAITNLTRLPFPTQYGPLILDRLIMNPGGGFPLATVNLVLGVVTCADKLSLLIEYEVNTINSSTVENIKARALELLFRSQK
jgi:hypothetical protein